MIVIAQNWITQLAETEITEPLKNPLQSHLLYSVNQRDPRPNDKNRKEASRSCDEHRTAQIPVATRNSLLAQRKNRPEGLKFKEQIRGQISVPPVILACPYCFGKSWILLTALWHEDSAKIPAQMLMRRGEFSLYLDWDQNSHLWG